MLALAIAVSALAAEVRLGPETPLSPKIEIGPAAYTQYPIDVAANGGEFVALWVTYAASQRTFQVARIGPGVNFGTVITGASSARLAGNGEDDLLVFASGSKIYAQRIGNDGVPRGEALVVTDLAFPSVERLVFNGSVFFLLASDSNGRRHALILDREGAVVRELPPFPFPVVWAGAQNGEFVLLDSAHTLHRFSAFGPPADIPLDIDGDLLFAAASPSRLFVGERQALKLIDLYGRVVWQTNESTCTGSDTSSFSAWWDGSNFVSACAAWSGGLYAARYADDGTLIGGATFLSSTAGEAPLFATNGTDQLLVWSDRRFSADYDVVARVVHGIDSVAPGAEPQLASYSGRAQRAVQIARAGERRLAVWRDEGRHVDAVLDGRTVFVQPASMFPGRPAVVAGDHSFLTVWNDAASFQLLGRRVDFSGALLDAQPLLLANNVSNFRDVVPGTGYRAPLFVVAVGDDSAHARGVRDDGALADVAAPRDAPNYAIVKPMWIGAELQFATGMLDGGLHYSPGVFPYYFTFGVATPGKAPAAVTRSGDFYRTTPPPGAIAQGPDRLMFAWAEGGGAHIAIAQSSVDGGRAIGVRTQVAEGWDITEVDAVWNGSEYVVAWSGGVSNEVSPRIRAMRFDINGQPLDASPITISPLGATADRPSLAVTAAGVDIAYSRFDEQAGGAPRAFVRSLDRVLPPIIRARAARH